MCPAVGGEAPAAPAVGRAQGYAAPRSRARGRAGGELRNPHRMAALALRASGGGTGQRVCNGDNFRGKISGLGALADIQPKTTCRTVLARHARRPFKKPLHSDDTFRHRGRFCAPIECAMDCRCSRTSAKALRRCNAASAPPSAAASPRHCSIALPVELRRLLRLRRRSGCVLGLVGE
jgi:hypothetical protein